MAVQTDYVYDVSDFGCEVIERSREVPVLVDFWAPWCGPCRMLSPVLEKLAEEFAGAFVLAKVNTEDHPEPSSAYGVRGIPAVKLFVDGDVTAEFVGALPEPQVRTFLREHCPSEADKLVSRGHEQLAQGDEIAAKETFESAVARDPQCYAAHLALAQLALQARDFDAMREHVQAIAPTAKERETGQYLDQAAAFIQEADAAGTEPEMRKRLDADPDDTEARYALAAHLMAAHKYREALDELLTVAERDRKWREEAARKAMLTIFGVIGIRHPLSDEYRKKLMFVY